jgi:hypothetical protein
VVSRLAAVTPSTKASNTGSVVVVMAVVVVDAGAVVTVVLEVGVTVVETRLVVVVAVAQAVKTSQIRLRFIFVTSQVSWFQASIAMSTGSCSPLTSVRVPFHYVDTAVGSSGIAATERSTMKIYVGNLPFSTTNRDLETMFEKYGTVESAQVVTDRDTGRSRGFGFVEMNDESARKAITEMAEAAIDGRRLTVNEAKPRPQGGGDRRPQDRNRSRSGGYSR